MTNGPAHYVISDPSQEVLREQITSLPQRLKNPFKIMREWVKGEIFDLQSVLEAIGHKDGMEGAKTRTETRIRKDKETLDKMNAGKKTFKTLFKSSTGKASEITKIDPHLGVAYYDAHVAGPYGDSLMQLVAARWA